jgi:SAM-dependent methyltransferase
MSEIVFDRPEYMRINAVREEWLRKVLDKLPFRSRLVEALDLGCGAGYFSKVLWDLGMRVTGLDLRPTNIELCRRRYPGITFGEINLDSLTEGDANALGRFDLVLMFGLLYHLESPLQAVRQLAPCIGQVAIVETRVAQGNAVGCYFHREHLGDDQNAARIVAVPTFPALAGMFSWSGVPYVYVTEDQPVHEQWDSRRYPNGVRRQFIIAREEIVLPGFTRVEAPEPLQKWQPIPGLDRVEK